MHFSIFFSWQSEIPKVTEIIRDNLQKCCCQIANEQNIEIELIESDTKNRGSYNINNAVISAIKDADIVVADLTPTNTGTDGRALPNANVIYEYAFACAEKGFENVLAVADVSNQSVKNMPFDWNHNSIVCFNGYNDPNFIENLKKELDKIVKSKLLPVLHESTVTFFSLRMAQSFPGKRGLTIIEDPHDIRRHLETFFRPPIKFGTTTDPEGDRMPIWWFRGGLSEEIGSFRALKNGIYLIGWNEMKIKRIAVYSSSQYYAQYIYVETDPLQPIFKDQYTPEYIEKVIQELGFCDEEYAIVKEGLIEKTITRQEYDDGYADINGEIIPVSDKTELRCRFLSTFNFVVCAKFSSINCPRFDLESRPLMEGILNGTHTIQDLHDLITSLPKPQYHVR